MNEICAELENPFGEDANDIPLLLMHKDFVNNIDEIKNLDIPKLYYDLFDKTYMPPTKQDEMVRLQRPWALLSLSLSLPRELDALPQCQWRKFQNVFNFSDSAFFILFLSICRSTSLSLIHI